MAIVWNNEGAFEEHAERVREFRRSHANVALVNGLRLDESALLEGMRLLQVRCTEVGTGGLVRYASAEDWSALVPVWRVAWYKFSPN